VLNADGVHSAAVIGAGLMGRPAAVIGAGLMGRRIAGLLGRAGMEVRLFDADEQILADGIRVARELAPEAGVEPASSLADCVRGAEFALEAVVEDLAVKVAIFAEASAANATAILASNSSVIPITAIAEQAVNPSRCVGTHFWNPPDLIPIVEVVRGRDTSDATMDRTLGLMTAIGKLAVRVDRDVPGFVGNRLQHALWREAIDLVATGVCDAQTVDLVVKNTIGLRLGQMGPIENADYVGLDLTLAIHEQVLPSINADPYPSEYLRGLVAQGKLGAKTGQGFLAWPPGRRETAATELAAHVAAQLTAAGMVPAVDTDERNAQ
jgi:3-hydroxybutyryl-CoA dehydrogenase